MGSLRRLQEITDCVPVYVVTECCELFIEKLGWSVLDVDFGLDVRFQVRHNLKAKSPDGKLNQCFSIESASRLVCWA